MLKSWIAAAALSLVATASLAQTQTEIVMQYPYPELFTETHKKISEEFAKVQPNIKVTMRAPYESYEDGTQKVLREAVTNQMPDVSFQGLNRIRVLVDKNIPAQLDDYIAAEKDFDKQGFHQAMFDIGTASGKVYALPFAISLPIVYVNLDLVKQAGGDPANLPKTWDELIVLAKKIKALGNDINASPTPGTSPAIGCGKRRCSRAAALCSTPMKPALRSMDRRASSPSACLPVW
ncbi:extracellular solute-binding protein [Bradyrhizobium hereditatis]|uniref:extracellular solute-binding protein n=1 Tax=Bradyrhizobium hereditatis TaxID=2821405 RepID=UPI0024BF493A|nr:extracellular solute-binding protein [Bradyrhizobium hereditatis]